MRVLNLTAALAMTIGALAGQAWGHGFSLSINYDGNNKPASLNVSSQGAFFDLFEATDAPSNVFIEQFGGTPFTDAGGTYYSATHGFVQTAGAWPAYTATYDVVTPLYFADGSTIAAKPAVAGTSIDMFNRFAGNPFPATAPHPGASAGDVILTGTTTYSPGYGVSLFDAHELEKDLYIGSGPTFGEYGYGYMVTVHFASGVTLRSPILVNAFAISDPDTGGFADNASVQMQDRATKAIYDAAMADVSFNGVVNAQDIAVAASHWLNVGSIGQVPGDANRDGVVNAQDIAIISGHWQANSGPAAAQAVPEPGSMVLAFAAAVLLCGWLRRPRRRGENTL